MPVYGVNHEPRIMTSDVQATFCSNTHTVVSGMVHTPSFPIFELYRGVYTCIGPARRGGGAFTEKRRHQHWYSSHSRACLTSRSHSCSHTTYVLRRSLVCAHARSVQYTVCHPDCSVYCTNTHKLQTSTDSHKKPIMRNGSYRFWKS